jgi:hypothetical protein
MSFITAEANANQAASSGLIGNQATQPTDPITGMPVQQGIQPAPQPLPANMQGGRQQNFVNPQQLQTGQQLFKGEQPVVPVPQQYNKQN